MHVRSTDDPQRFLDEAAERLASDPVRHNVHLTVAADCARRDLPGRYWWVEDRGTIVGTAMASHRDVPLSLGPMDADATAALAAAVAAQVPGLTSAIGPAAAASTFAGAWASACATPAAPLEGQRLYRCDAVRTNGRDPAPGGLAREATPDDADLLVDWCDSFARDTGGSLGGDTRTLVDGIVAARTGWVWEHDGEPVAMLRATVPAHGVSRVGIVYTPPPHRRRGHAEALVADITGRLLCSGVDAAVLFTQLSNPTSNAIYQRVGYEPVDEILSYRFG